ncbi:cobalamin biosynthesis protein [Bradyrhizobium sp. BWA-3-5]|uniref:cobalamin biosynthesis protein n=1 Tax=Bradyrhizobium sp. BWA-3-5 TaxID=3080013 RepID=UPI00293F5AF8|nr:cobalamin biosynthesis protein [Bradyrhizobium sp. BWA-3-5]WOH64139.1 cobalamin biosynthesis protein [Bradyrhizobium sp. BWA-3-5]WOH64256.1 cobalamin biosynthesis protein [Bradyrhizobium sp. BWA-3-5]WOH70184.1 cobalamin biosynthesis protein [Bradyrhizobium sp. BWA-3-5]
MKVAGLGFKQDVTLASLREALDAAGGSDGLAAVATVSDKAEAAALKALACELNVSVRSVPADVLAGIVTSTQSEFIKAKFGTGSVAEAAALAVAGRGARLVSARTVSQDRMATAAIAEGDGE